MESTYFLDEVQHDEIYRNQIYEYFKPFLKSSLNPLAIILGGQPGSGKSLLTQYIENKYIENSFCVIDGDFIRTFHPQWTYFLSHCESLAPDLTQNDSNKWVNRLLDDAVRHRADILIEGTMRNPHVPLNTARFFKAHRYRVEAHVLAVPKSLSTLGIYERYEAQKSTQKYGRLSPISVHDEAYSSIPISIKLLEENRFLDSIFVYGRRKFYTEDNEIHEKFLVVYKNHFRDNQWLHSPIGHLRLEHERHRAWTPEEKALLVRAWTTILTFAYERPDSTKTYIANIHRYRNQAMKRAKKDKKACKVLQDFGFLEEWLNYK